MDKVRFGRALGYGARHAMKAMMQAADAATSPDPAAKSAARPAAAPQVMNSAQPFRATAAQAVKQAARVQAGARQARKGALAPVKKFSRVLWLEVTGSFFALVAAAIGRGIWMQRAALLSGAATKSWQVYLEGALLVLFVYFAVSSFVRARRIDAGSR